MFLTNNFSFNFKAFLRNFSSLFPDFIILYKNHPKTKMVIKIDHIVEFDIVKSYIK